MTMINPQAEALNSVIGNANSAVLSLLSRKGKEIFFPKKGIMAQAAQAKNCDINATIGIALEDNGEPVALNSISSVIDMEKAKVFPYASSYGVPELRKEWKRLLYKKNPSLKTEDISEPIVTCALTHGLSIAGYLFLDQGDEVIVPDFFYGNYKLIFNNGFNVKFNPFNFLKDGGFDTEAFSEVLNKKEGKQVVLLNFPNNPTGYTPTEEEARAIADELKKSAERGNKLLVFLDDAYFGLVFKDGVFKESLFSYLADIHENILAIKLDGITKEDYAWGFRVGFMTYGTKGGTRDLYECLEAKTAGAVRGNISNAPHLSQSLALKALTDENYDSEKHEKYLLLEKRYRVVCEILAAHKEYEEFFTPIPYNSGYFMCINMLKHNADEIRVKLIEKYSTGLIAFDNNLRIAFSSTPTDKLETLFENIYRACKE